MFGRVTTPDSDFDDILTRAASSRVGVNDTTKLHCPAQVTAARGLTHLTLVWGRNIGRGHGEMALRASETVGEPGIGSH